MIKQELKTILTDTLGIDIEALKEGLTSEDEVEVSYKSGTFMDDESLNAFKEKLEKQGYENGKVAGVEMKAKEIKDKYGLQVEGKDFDKLFETYASKKMEEAKIEPSKKIKEYEETISNLQNTAKSLEEKMNANNQQWEQRYKNEKINNELTRHFPELSGIKPSQAAILARSEFDFDYNNDGSLVIKQNGKILKDKLENPLPVTDVLNDWSKNNGWVKVAGRGGVNEPGNGGGKFKTLKDVYKHLESENIQPDSQEGQSLIHEFKELNDKN